MSDRLDGRTGQPPWETNARQFHEILARARAADQEATMSLYRLLYPRVVRYLRVLQPADADRLAADTWADVVRRLAGFNGDERELYALALQTARSRIRRQGRRRTGDRWPKPTPASDMFRSADPDDDGMAGFGLRSALAAIADLPRDEAEVVLLRVLGGLSVDEVAKIMTKRSGTVRTLQQRALHALNWTASRTAASR